MRNRELAIILSFIFGGLGLHKFYLRKFGMTILYLALCWTLIPVMLGVIDGVILLFTSTDKFDRKYN